MEELKNLFEEHTQKILLGLIGLILIVIGIFFLRGFQIEDKEEAPSPDLHEELMVERDIEKIGIDTDLIEDEQFPQEIIVDVKGAIIAPGVYTLTPHNRVIDAIEMAGGFESDADQNAVNLAKVVEDQMVIYIPKIGEEEFQGVNLNQASAEALEDEATESLVNINSAEKEALMTLNGIGSSKADSILNYREENGLFQTIEEIKNVSGIGDATFENLKDSITISP